MHIPDQFEQALDVLDTLTPELQVLDERYRADGVVWRRSLPHAETVAQRVVEQLSQLAGEAATNTGEGASAPLRTRILPDERNGDEIMPTQQTARPQKRRITSVITWLAPVAAVLLIAVLATLVFANRHIGTSITGKPTPIASKPSSIATLPGIHLVDGSYVNIVAISMLSANEGWVIARQVGLENGGIGPDLILHDHNGTWGIVPYDATSAGNFGGLRDISADSPTDVWIVAWKTVPSTPNNYDIDTYVSHYDGHKWTRQLLAAEFDTIKMFSPTNGWATAVINLSGTGYVQVYHYDGRTWNALPEPNVPNCSLADPDLFNPDIPPTSTRDTGVFVPLVDGEVWAVGVCNENFKIGEAIESEAGKIILHYDGHTWSVESFPVPDANSTLFAISMTSPQEGWAVGYTATTTFLLHYSQGQWQLETNNQFEDALQQASKGSEVSTGFVESFSMLSANEGWLLVRPTFYQPALMRSIVLHDHNGHWAPVTLPLAASNQSATNSWTLTGMTTLPSGDVWVYGTIIKSITLAGQHQAITVELPLLFHYSNGAWSVVLD